MILGRLKARRALDALQRPLWRENEDFHETIRAKLVGRWEDKQFWNFSRCGQEDFFRTCRECRTVQKFKCQCNLKWCPRCQWRLTEKRKKILGLWAQRIRQPKHLVLTQKNFPVLTRGRIREHTQALAKMRRSHAMKTVKGGCVSVEITNEERGWHLHSHWLLDVRWLDMEQVSKTWAKLVGQDFAVCKVMDVRQSDYLREVTKYVCDGSEMAKWSGEHLNEFVRAIKGRRFFFPFGSLFHQSKEIRRELRAEAREPEPCECGCTEFIWEDEVAAVVNQLRREKHL